MATAAEQQERFERALTEEDLKFEHEDDQVTSLCFGGGDFSYPHLRVLVIFDEDGEGVHLISTRFVQIPEGRADVVMRICNACNKRFRWIRFFIDNDGDLVCDADAVITEESCAKVCTELTWHMASIMDRAYPEFMKALWA